MRPGSGIDGQMAPHRIIRGTSLALVLCVLPACSLRRMAGKTIADSLAHGSSTYAQDDDPELVREALPFGLKTLEGLSTDLPRHRPLLRSLASGFTSYAVAYVVPESERLESIDVLRRVPSAIEPVVCCFAAGTTGCVRWRCNTPRSAQRFARTRPAPSRTRRSTICRTCTGRPRPGDRPSPSARATWSWLPTCQSSSS